MSLAKHIDHTLLKPEATRSQIEQLCREAIEHQFFGVCVNSFWLPFCASVLKNSQTKLISVVGFPLGACFSEAKADETRRALGWGAEEVDMVLNLGLAKAGSWSEAARDIEHVVSAAAGLPVKVILETHLLSREEIMRACEVACSAGAHFVKTSTGFSGGGATVEDVILMKESVQGRAKVKASGGIKTRDSAWAMIEAGADRIGTSSSVSIVANATVASDESDY
jgi:deoxyribose-phosphate aldolase